MKRSRPRSSIKWSCTVLTVLLLVVWVGSAWWVVSTPVTKTFAGVIAAGQVTIVFDAREYIYEVEDFYFGKTSRPFAWSFGYLILSDAPLTVLVFIPLWAIATLTALLSAWLWYRDRRRGPGLCGSCGYDLRGNTRGVCPECGGKGPGEIDLEEAGLPTARD